MDRPGPGCCLRNTPPANAPTPGRPHAPARAAPPAPNCSGVAQPVRAEASSARHENGTSQARRSPDPARSAPHRATMPWTFRENQCPSRSRANECEGGADIRQQRALVRELRAIEGELVAYHGLRGHAVSVDERLRRGQGQARRPTARWRAAVDTVHGTCPSTSRRFSATGPSRILPRPRYAPERP